MVLLLAGFLNLAICTRVENFNAQWGEDESHLVLFGRSGWRWRHVPVRLLRSGAFVQVRHMSGHWVSRATTDQSKSAVAKAQVVLITDGALVRSLLSRNIGEWTERGRSKSTHGRSGGDVFTKWPLQDRNFGNW